MATAAWRLTARHVPPAWRIGLLLCSAVAGMLALGWWLRRRWVPARAGAVYLDQTFGLEQRLVTAAEFAATGADQPLYPLLVEETATRLFSALKTAEKEVRPASPSFLFRMRSRKKL